MRNVPKSVIIVAILAVILVVATIGYVQIFSSKKLRIGFLQGDLHQLAFFVAAEKGFFYRENIDFDYFAYENGVKEMEAFKAGAIDAGYLGIAPASYRAIKEDVNITIVAGANAEGSLIVAGSDSGINGVSDLVEKTVAFPGNSTVQDILLRIALQKQGLSYKNLTGDVPVAMKVSDMSLALQEGSIDAYIAWEPFDSKAIVGGYGHAVVNGSSHEIWPGHPCCVLAVRNDFLEGNTDLVRRLVKAHVDATRWMAVNPDEAVVVAKKWTNLSEEVVRLAMSHIIFFYKPDVDGVKQYIQYLIGFGYVKEDEVDGGIDSFIQRFVNTQIVEEVE